MVGFNQYQRSLNSLPEVGFGFIEIIKESNSDTKTKKYVYFNKEGELRQIYYNVNFSIEIIEGPVSALFTTSNPKVEFQIKPITFSSHINGAETWRRPVNQAVNIKITPGDTPRFDKLASQVKTIFVVFYYLFVYLVQIWSFHRYISIL